MKKRLDPASPEFRDLVKSTTSMKFSLPPLHKKIEIEKMLTGIADVDREVLIRLDDRELFMICLSPKNKHSIKLCNEDFFRNRSMKFLSGYVKYKNPDISWKKFYVYTRQISDFIEPDSLERFFQYKNKPLFMNIHGGNLSAFLKNLKGKGTEDQLYWIAAPLLQFNMSTMEIVLKILIILQTLKLKHVPKNFIQYFDPIETLDDDHLQYVNHPDIKGPVKEMTQQLNRLYTIYAGNNLQFLRFWDKVYKF